MDKKRKRGRKLDDKSHRNYEKKGKKYERK